MSRYRKIETKMWGDTKFRSFPQNTQYLWIYLLTNPETTSLPGLYSCGKMAMVESLGWTMKSFLESFEDLSRNDMAKADWDARLIWIPKAIIYNRPQNPNVVKSWSAHWNDLPECPLKVDAYQALKIKMESLGESYLKSFLESFGESIPESGAVAVAVAVAGPEAGTGAGKSLLGQKNPNPKKPKTKAAKSPLTPPAKNFTVSEHEASKFREKYGPAPIEALQYQSDCCMDHHRAKGNVFADWNAVLRTWFKNWQTDFGKIDIATVRARNEKINNSNPPEVDIITPQNFTEERFQRKD